MDGAERPLGEAPERAPESLPAGMRMTIDGALRASISRAVVRIHAEHYGKGATQAKTYAFENLIVTVLRDVFTTLESTLIGLDRADTVRALRTSFQDSMSQTFIAAIEELTGRQVESCMSQVDPASGMGVEVFVLVPERPAGRMTPPPSPERPSALERPALAAPRR
jgi:uncharacterized protein YbcI